MALSALLLAACVTPQRTPDHLLAALSAKPGSHLAGRPLALGERLVLNREDFVYDAKLSPAADRAALSRLGMKSFHLSVHELTAPPRRVVDLEVNPHAHDVEAVEFSPDGAKVATVSRDGALRVYAASDGALVAAWLTEEPLVTLGWHPSGELLALGSAKGLVTLVSFPRLEHVAEVRAHTDEVRATVFSSPNELVTAGWDRRLRVLTLTDATSAPSEVRAHVEKKNGQVLFRAVLDRSASATVALDQRLPMLVVRPALAQAAGLDALALTETVQIATQFGAHLAKVARGRTLSIKGLTFERIDVALCEACVPPDAQAALGGPLLQQLSVAFDDAAGELVFTLAPGAANVSLGSTRVLSPARLFTLPAPINDLTVDAAGAVAGVALSETKAERTKAVYDREKKGEAEPERAWDCGARVDLATGKVLEQVRGHRGVVATAAISPDGQTLATGGWDKQLILHGERPHVDARFGWALRRVRFSRDGRRLVAAAWTPQNALGDHQSDPAAVVYELVYRDAVVR